MPLQDMASYFISIYASGITVPKAEETNSLPSYRHVAFLSLDKNGIIKLNGVICPPEELDELLFLKLQEDRQIVLSLIIDKNIEMYKVNQLLSTIREAGLWRINFMCTNTRKIL